jgi:tetratricopeptide (TPR) repeat protein
MRIRALAILAIVLAGCPNSARNDSVTVANKASEAYGKKQYETAIDMYTKATDRWRENHAAWYGLAAAYAAKLDWADAEKAAGTAVQLAPEVAMYQLMYGKCLYKKTIAAAKQEQADREKKKPEQVEVDVSSLNFEKPLQHLNEAVKLNNDLWRAHMYIGLIYRDTNKYKEAATELTKALESAPTDPQPWVELAELYRHWDYTDQAIQVAEQGAAVVPGENEKSDIWFEVGMGYDDKRLDDKAIEAFDKSLEANRSNQKAKFSRGQAYFRKGDYTKAKRDLEEFSKAGGASVEFFKQQASRMLMDIAAKSAMPTGAGSGAPAPGAGSGASASPTTPGQKMSPEDLVKKSKEQKEGKKGK